MKLFGFVFTLCLTCALCVSASASALQVVAPDRQLTLPPAGAHEIQPFGWNGTAPQVTRIELYNFGFMENGNFGVILKVTGYGNDMRRAFFNGNPLSSKQVGYFINYGNTADGFYWLYDCGPITEAGSYPFTTTYKSTNAPYGTLTYTDEFVFSPVE